MIRGMFDRLLAWLTQPLYDSDDPLDEFWSRRSERDGGDRP